MASTPRKQETPPPGSKLGTVGRFELHGELHTGELLSRYLGRGPGPDGNDKLVAVLQLAPALAANRTIASAVAGTSRALMRVHHPNLLGTLEVVERSNGLYVVTEYAEGLTISELLAILGERNEQLPLDVALRILVDTLRGLDAVHETADAQGRKGNILHGAVGVDTVLVGVDGVARLRDFGFARAARRYQSNAGAVALLDASPEELAGETVDKRADLFAAAALAWRCVTGHPLVDLADEKSAAEQLARAKFDPPSKHNVFVPHACDDAIMRGLERDPASRWATAGEMANALAAAAVVATPGRLGKWIGRVGSNHLLDRAKKIATLTAATATAAAIEPVGQTPSPSPPKVGKPVVPKATPPPRSGAKSDKKSPSVPPAMAPPHAAPAPGTAVPAAAAPPAAATAPEIASGAAPGGGTGAPGAPVVVVEDESPTIGMITRASEGAKNFQAVTTQLLRPPSDADARGKPAAPTVKVALNLDGPAPGAMEPAAAAAHGPAAMTASVAPDEQPTLKGDRSGAQVLASAAAVGQVAMAPGAPPDLALGAPAPSQPGPAMAAPAVASAPVVAAAPPFVEPATLPREAFDDLPTVEAPRGSSSFGVEAEGLGGASDPGQSKSKVGLYVGVVAALGLVVAGVVWIAGLGGGGAAGDAGPTSQAGPSAEAAAAATAGSAAGAGSAEQVAENTVATDTSTAAGASTTDEAAVADNGPTADRAPRPKPKAGGAKTASTDTEAAPPEDPYPPPTAAPPPRPTSTGAKPRPTSKPKSEDDLFGRK